MLIPLLSADSATAASARAGECPALALCGAALSASAVLGCFAGPFDVALGGGSDDGAASTSAALGAAAAALDAGALAAVVAVDEVPTAALASALAELAPPARLVLLLRGAAASAARQQSGGGGDDEDASALSALRAAAARVSSVWLAAEELPSAAAATAAAAAAATALRARLALGEASRAALLLPAGAPAPAPSAVGALHAALCDVVAAAPAAELGVYFAACARSDRADGLFATVVVDECGKALGLVYSSAESLAEAVRCRRGVYYSRSRGGLWRKGDSSGAYQELLSLRLDCDSDAVQCAVRQRGSPPAFCHLSTRSCWGEDGGLTALQRTLAARLAAAPAGSYTARLFADGALLRAKLLEEAQELAEAAEPDHVAAEAADLIYFALVAAVKGGAALADVERHLDRRALKLTRRQGDAKAARTAAAEAELAAAAAVKAGLASPRL